MATDQFFQELGGENATANSSDGIHDSFTKYVSDEVLTYFTIFFTTIFSNIVSLVGVVTNIINIIVFLRQGVFSDSSTVSLFCLGFADFSSAATMLLTGIMCCVAEFAPSDLNWKPHDFMYLAAAFPHMIFGLITRMITAFISFERCFCVVFPFKVRKIFSPRCSFASMLSIFAYYLITYSVVYILQTFHWVTDPVTNRTHLILYEHPEWQMAQFLLGFVNLYILNFCSVIIVLICTTITVSRVKLSSAWRESMSTSNTNDTAGTVAKIKTATNSEQRSKDAKEKSPKLSSSKMQKEKKLIRMITLVSTIFLICYIPHIALPTTYNYDREIRTDGKYKNLAWLIHVFSWTSETINSSINIFIYYRMSTRYREEFNKLFGIKEK